jgi:probable phosphoglycerate mutase
MTEVRRTLVLVRHGETDAMRDGRYCGWSDPPLNATGRAQSAALTAALGSAPFDRVWSSDLRRCVETAELAGLKPVVDRRLREINFGDLELRVWDDLDEVIQAALLDFDAFEAPGGESMPTFRDRVDAFFDALPAGRHLVITHGGVIRLLLGSRQASVGVDPCVPIVTCG